MAFSEQVLEEIQSKSDIAEVIGRYISLRRAGGNFKANCPFHKEKTPSFMVSPAKQIFHCFGCGAGGNVFSFVMKIEGVEFPEAVRILAEKAGVSLPHFSRAEFEQSSYATQIYKVNELAVLYYQNMLSESGKGKEAIEYLKRRGVSSDTIIKAKLGFASQSWEGFVAFAKSKGFNAGLLERAGLALTREDGGYYDRFRNKIMFPILDIKDKVVAFGARVLDDSLPKYINSPETEVYVKSRHLYGFNLSVQAVKDKDLCVIVEGYLDFLIPFQNGIGNIVASLGTSLTDLQARLIKRYTKNVVMLYDGDSAGEAASLRGLDLLLQEGMNVRIAVLPKGYDPDSFVRENGVADFNSLVSSALSLFDYKLGILVSRHNPREAIGKSKICAEMLPTIARISDSILKHEYLKQLSERLQVREEALFSALKQVKSDYSYEPKVEVCAQRSFCDTPEKIIIGIMLEDPGYIAFVRDSLKADEFTDESARDIISEIFEAYSRSEIFKPSQLINRLNNEDLSRIVSEAVSFAENITERRRNLEDCVKKIKERNANGKLLELRNLIKVAEMMGDEAKVYQLVSEYNDLLKCSREFARR
ncbi:MAG: DNA primase [Candidatus Omnitrophota bacterium]